MIMKKIFTSVALVAMYFFSHAQPIVTDKGMQDDFSTDTEYTDPVSGKSLFWWPKAGDGTPSSFVYALTRNSITKSLDIVVNQALGKYEPFGVGFGDGYSIDITSNSKYILTVKSDASNTQTVKFRLCVQDENGNLIDSDISAAGGTQPVFADAWKYSIDMLVAPGATKTLQINVTNASGNNTKLNGQFGGGLWANYVGGGAWSNACNLAKVKGFNLTVVNSKADASYNPLALVNHKMSVTLLKVGDLSVCNAAAPSCPGKTINSGQTASLTASGGTTYKWYTTSSGGTAVYTGATYTTPALSQTTTYYVANNNGTCESPRTAVTVTVSSTPPTSGPGLCNTVKPMGFVDDFSTDTDYTDPNGNGGIYWWPPSGTSTIYELTRNSANKSLDVTVNQAAGAYEPFGMSFGDTYAFDFSQDLTYEVTIKNDCNKPIFARLAAKDANGKFVSLNGVPAAADAWKYSIDIKIDAGGTGTIIKNAMNDNNIALSGTFDGGSDVAWVGGVATILTDFDKTKVAGFQLTIIDASANPPGALSGVIHITKARVGNVNCVVGVNETSAKNNYFTIYPNPVTNGVLNFNGTVSDIYIYNAAGQMVKSVYKADKVNVNDLSKGLYMIKTSKGFSKFTISK